MRTVERIILKIIGIQVFFLAIGIFLHHFNVIPTINQITQYEGVMDSNFVEMLETISR
ncbi:DUF5359 family protein [Bacillus sp. B1-b2]|uniref:DUF5359 family protein n=1 Tax=Bacillus sp. B1-b2 TaxID=2653201 RepID=UPI001869E321|nr:DUF5359 family protein [Bacillus sp. B1-b2]